MNNLSSYCGLVDARISASDKYLSTCIETLEMWTLNFELKFDGNNNNRFSSEKELPVFNCQVLEAVNCGEKHLLNTR